MTEDPFYNIDHSLKFQNSISKHWHEIFASFMFYFIIQQLSGPIFSIIMGPRYTKLSKSTRVNFDVHVLPWCNALFHLHLWSSFEQPTLGKQIKRSANSLLGSTDFGGLVALTVGYFIGIFTCALSTFFVGVGFYFTDLLQCTLLQQGLFHIVNHGLDHFNL